MDLSKLHLHWGMSSYKGKSYRSYSLARSYRVNGKNRKKPVVKLGKLSDSEVETWRNLLKTIKRPGAFFTTREDIVVTHHYSYLDVVAANAIWDAWKLDHAFRDDGTKRAVKLADVARILSVNRCIDPVAKSKTPEWFQHTALPHILDIDPSLINRSRIFRELEQIENRKEAICDHLFKQMKHNNPDSIKSVFYDLSTTTFSGTRCLLMKWGHCKEGYRYHVVLALLVNKEGLPFYWEALPGGTADAKTITWLLERVKKRFKNLDITLVFDRGMVSDENLSEIELAGIKYISAMDRNQIEKIVDIKFDSFSHFEPENIDSQIKKITDFEKLNDATYYQEIKIAGKRRFILCFNPALFKDQRKAREEAVSNFKDFVKELNAELHAAKKSRQRKPTYEKFERQLKKNKLNSFVDVKLDILHVNSKNGASDIRTYKAEVIVDEEKMTHAGQLDGFWLLVTNHIKNNHGQFELSAAKAIMPYREKTIIESAFRDVKSFIEISPVFVWREIHVQAHYTSCVLAYLIDRSLDLRLHSSKGNLTEDVVSHQRLFKQLADCKIDKIKIKNIGLSTCNITQPTPQQLELLKRIELTSLMSKKKLKAIQNWQGI